MSVSAARDVPARDRLSLMWIGQFPVTEFLHHYPRIVRWSGMRIPAEVYRPRTAFGKYESVPIGADKAAAGSRLRWLPGGGCAVERQQAVGQRMTLRVQVRVLNENVAVRGEGHLQF